jgi:hypothetical protein
MRRKEDRNVLNTRLSGSHPPTGDSLQGTTRAKDPTHGKILVFEHAACAACLRPPVPSHWPVKGMTPALIAALLGQGPAYLSCSATIL